MKSVLFVDDEKSFLLSLEEGLKHSTEFKAITATSGKKAVEVLGRTKVDLVVTDLNMPEMNGFELMAFLMKAHPEIPVIVMTAYATPEIKTTLEKLGSFRLHEKPIDLNELSAEVRASLNATNRGYVKGITLPAFLQLVEMERTTCTLKIASHGATGFLCFLNGVLVDAQTQRERGEAAAYEIVSWDEVEIEINSICRTTTNLVGKALRHVLMEGLRRKDERRAKAAAVPSRAAEKRAPAAAPTPAPVARAAAPRGAAAKAAEPQAAADQKDDATMEEDDMPAVPTLKDVLVQFTKVPGVHAVCLVGRDGFLLDSIAQTGIDAEMVGAIASSGFGASDSMGKQLGKGSMLMSMTEFEGGPVLFAPVGEDSVIVIIANREANLGMVRLKLKKHGHELELAAASAI